MSGKQQRKSRARPVLAWLVVAAVVGGPTLAGSPPASATQAKRNHLPASSAEAFRDPDFPDDHGDLDMPTSCGSGNITGKFSPSTWTVQSTIGTGSTVWIGEEWMVTFSIGQRYAGPPNGNNGPDPLTLELLPAGPVESASAPKGAINDWSTAGPLFSVFSYHNFSGDGAKNFGLHGPIGAWGYSFDSNSSPGVLDFSDGASVRLTTKMKANAVGVITLPKIHIGGYDGTYPAGAVSCDLDVGWSWKVATPLSPVGVPDSAKVNASYTSFTIDDASDGSHRFRIPVLANDDDPNTAGGPGQLSELGISDWSAQSSHGGQVTCGTIKNAAHSTALADLGHSCEYQPPQGYAGPDTFHYRLRQASDGLEKIVPVNITVLANTAPTAADALFSAAQGEDKDFDLSGYADDPEKDPTSCATGLVTDPFPAVGIVTLDSDCSFHWNNTSPAFTGDVSFTYRTCDTHPTLAMADMGTGIVKLNGFSTGDLSGAATRRCRNADATIKVKGLGLGILAPPTGVTDVDVVDAGYAADDIGSYTVSVDVLANDTDSNGPAPTMPTAKVAIKTPPAPGEGAAVAKANGHIEFTPADGFSGPVSFTYKVCEDPDQQNPAYEGAAACGSGIVKIDVLGNAAPNAIDDEFEIEATSLLVNAPLAVNDTDPEDEGVFCETDAASVSAPAKVETLSIQADCALSLNPVDDATGSIEVGYTICDDHNLAFPLWPKVPYGQDGRDPGDEAARCSIGIATITLAAPPVVPPEIRDREPMCADDEAHTAHDTPVTIDVLANDSDVNHEGDPSPLMLPGPTADEPMPTKTGGSIQLDADPTRLQYTPVADFEGEDGFDYLAVDTAGQTCQAHVVVIVDPVGNPGTTTTMPGRITTTTTPPGSTTTTAPPGSTTTTNPGGKETTTTTAPGGGSPTTTAPSRDNPTSTTNRQQGDTPPTAGVKAGNLDGSANGSRASVLGADAGATTVEAGSLPVTGSNTGAMLVAALVLVAGGGVALAGARRRR